jgi:hypothetical protein
VNGHIDDTVRAIRRDVEHAQAPHLFLNDGKGGFRDAAAEVGSQFAAPKVARGAAYADFDRDGDLDILITTNNGPARLYRNDNSTGNRSVRFKLTGTKSNKDAIGAIVRIESSGLFRSAMVKTGSSYLSQSELPLTFGLGKRTQVDRLVIRWPSGRTDEHKALPASRLYHCTEGSKPAPSTR